MEQSNVVKKDAVDTVQETENKLLNIVNDDWLQDISTTRFSLKKKTKKTVAAPTNLEVVKQFTMQEDENISEQNLNDEKVVSQFLGNKSPETHTEKEITVSASEPIATTVENKEVVKEASSVPAAQTKPQEAMIAPVVATVVAPASNTVVSKVSDVSNAQQEDMKPNVLLKFIALGLAKLYVKKTNTILNPLRFVLENRMKVLIAAIQFIVPALMTWWMTSNVSIISEQLVRETNFVQWTYRAIFYFACMFLWISGQVVLGGVFNMFKKTLTDVAKTAQNKN